MLCGDETGRLSFVRVSNNQLDLVQAWSQLKKAVTSVTVMNFGEVAGAVTTEVSDISYMDHPHDRKICYSIEILSLEWPSRLIYTERKGLCSTLPRRLCSTLGYKVGKFNSGNGKLIRPNEGMAFTKMCFILGLL